MEEAIGISPELGIDLLELAYADDFGKTGHALAGHAVSDADVASVIEKGQGSSLLYGELLPEGVLQLSRGLYSGREKSQAQGPVLELGMGTGKVALQFFLSSPLPGRSVYGVELAPSRWELADAALKRVADAAPTRFSYEKTGEGSSKLCNKETGCACDIVCGSLLDTPPDLLVAASAVIMEVCLPKEVQILACKVLQHCPANCRVVCYAPLHGLAPDCRLAPVRCGESESQESRPELGDGKGGLCLPASWRPQGHGFAFYELAADRPAALAAWAAAAREGTCIEVDPSGNPSHGRTMKYTDRVFSEPKSEYSWGKGDKIQVGWSWLPFPDLGNPGDGSGTGIDGVTWLSAHVVSVDSDGFATVCYHEDGTVEEKVHPERIRREGFSEQREPVGLDIPPAT